MQCLMSNLKSARLPSVWGKALSRNFDLNLFYQELDAFLKTIPHVIPAPDKILNVFSLVKPQRVRCVLYGEDPYPRPTSANGVAFWDLEMNSWNDKTNNNSLKHILKALLIAKGLADYTTSIEQCRHIAGQADFPSPPQLFQRWLEQGVLLVNTALTFSTFEKKPLHLKFWQPFHQALIQTLNSDGDSPFYILWGKKAQSRGAIIKQSVDDPNKIIMQGHPAYAHQFLIPAKPDYSPFHEIIARTGMRWI